MNRDTGHQGAEDYSRDGQPHNLKDFVRIQQMLDLADRDEREILADLPPEQPGDHAFVRSVLGPMIAAPTTTSHRMLSLRMLAPVAAVVLAGVALYAWYMGVSTNEDTPEKFFGGEDARMSPEGDVGPVYPPFAWGLDCPAAGGFRVTILSLDADVILTSPDLTARQWMLPPEQERELPEQITWRLEVFDAYGEVVRSFSKSASRSSSVSPR